MVTCGIGIGTPRRRPISYISPTDGITETGTKRDIAGLTFEFLYAPDTEAPEEMHIWIPQLKALTCAENANHSLHNIQTLRGARTRDARNFARYLDETLERWGDEAEVNYGPHTWPVWGNANVVSFIESQRDTYKFIHDQALRLANKGYTPLEAAEVIELPEELGRKWFNRGYHGTLHHDVRAVYTKELGMWDGDPVSLHPHTAGRLGEAVRGPDRRREDPRRGRAGVRRGRLPVGRGDPAQAGVRRARQPGRARTAGRRVRADGLPGRGSAVARHLPHRGQGAARGRRAGRVRHRQPGHASWPCRSTSCSTSPPCTSTATKAAEVDLRIDFAFTDLDQTWTMWVRRGVLNARRGASPDTQLTVSGPKAALVGVVLQPAARGPAGPGRTDHARRRPWRCSTAFAGVIDEFDPNFNIVTP